MVSIDVHHAAIAAGIEQHATALEDLSLKIHSNPELSWKEFYAHDLLSSFLEEKGFKVTRKACDVATAFIAEWSTENFDDSPEAVTIAFLSEFDALPKIGHACGHNLIAISGVGAALAFRNALQSSSFKVRIKLFGTPAEEDTGGKISLIEKGAFQGCDVAMMVHPGRNNVTWAKYLALNSFHVHYYGVASHAAAEPWAGVNALDALVSAYQQIGLLRQQTLTTNRIHGIIKKGGDAANVIPDHTTGEF
ncbi:hypothetical protein HDU96_004858 [Phlyctochytrium bullatum]|nr:hypothetical protein HDU96_004858 [Phlyctochytrium bullatum]